MKCELCTWDSDTEFVAHRRMFTGVVPSQNELKSNTRFNYAYRKWRRIFERTVEMWQLPPAGRHEYRVGLITRYYGLNDEGNPTRAYDLENFIAGCKPFLDALKNKGVIYDDAEKYWRGWYFQSAAHDGISRLGFELRICTRSGSGGRKPVGHK